MSLKVRLITDNLALITAATNDKKFQKFSNREGVQLRKEGFTDGHALSTGFQPQRSYAR